MPGYPPETKQRVLEMYQEGQLIEVITQETGVPKATIFDWVRKAGITPNRIQRPMQAGHVEDLGTVIEERNRLRDELAVALSDLERERQITRWFLQRTLIDPAALAAELENAVRQPSRPRAKK